MRDGKITDVRGRFGERTGKALVTPGAAARCPVRRLLRRRVPYQPHRVRHTDYGLAGTLAAKMEGYRHLARYTTHTYPEPVRLRGQGGALTQPRSPA
jgi:hypothetical protein